MLQCKYKKIEVIVYMNAYIAYIEKILHIKVDFSVYTNCAILPLYLRSGYNLYIMTIEFFSCLLAQPKENNNLTVLRKQCVQLKKLTGLNCVLCLEGVRIYTKEKMLAEGIPFVIAEQQIYMPFLGIALKQNGIREIPQATRLSFSTQALLLSAIYQNWNQMTVTEAANILEMSKMSITRCFDELQSLGLPLIKSDKKMRRFVWEGSRRSLWDIVQTFLRNPVAFQYRFDKKINIETAKLGGLSAVCYYSMLSDNPWTVYAVSKETANTLALNKIPQIPKDETPDIIIQILRYDIKYPDTSAIDPLTAILSLTDEEKTDPRVEIVIEQILEDKVNG